MFFHVFVCSFVCFSFIILLVCLFVHSFNIQLLVAHHKTYVYVIAMLNVGVSAVLSCVHGLCKSTPLTHTHTHTHTHSLESK